MASNLSDKFCGSALDNLFGKIFVHTKYIPILSHQRFQESVNIFFAVSITVTVL